MANLFEPVNNTNLFLRRPQNFAKSNQLFVLCTASQTNGEDFAKFCGLLRIPYFLIQFQRKLFFFEFGNPKVIVHKGAETIQVRKLFKGGNCIRKYGKCLLLLTAPNQRKRSSTRAIYNLPYLFRLQYLKCIHSAISPQQFQLLLQCTFFNYPSLLLAAK